jgi:hypothetical protein
MKKALFTIILCFFFLLAAAQYPVKKRYSLLTDLPDTSAPINSMRLLMDELTVCSPDKFDKEDILSRKDGMLVFLSDGQNVWKIKKLINNYTRTGGTIVMDISAFAALTGYKTKDISMDVIYVREESDVTSGYKKTEPIRYSAKGKFKALEMTGKNKKLTVLGESEKADAVLVCLKKGRGRIIAVDMISLPEPQYSSGSENKYLFMVNAVGNRVKYGRYFPKKLNHEEFVEMIKELERQYPSVKVINEGDASGGYSIYSLNMGNPTNPGILIYSCTHGNEWETAYGTFNFVNYLAEHKEQNIIDFDRYCLKVIPILNPAGYDKNTRQNANLVDLNRNGDYAWDKFTGEDPANFKPGSYDWKGTAPFSEPESKTLKKAAESGNYYAFLDVHGNPSGTGYNKWMGVAANTKPDAKTKGELLQKTFNEAIRGRYILRQAREKYPKLMVIEKIMDESPSPNLYNTIARDKYGYIVEFLCGYGNSTGFIVMQDDIITELCIAFCKTFAL